MWYAASIFTKAESPNRPDSEALWEESIVLIKANSEAHARTVAEKIGRDSEVEYVGATDELISWRFIRVDRIQEIGEELKPNEEVFSRFLRASEAESLLTPFAD